MNFSRNAATIHQKIANAQNILLISHERPDGDSFGAALAIAAYLDREGRKYTHFAPTPAAPYFQFLPRAERLVCDYGTLSLQDFDVVITLDCGSITQTNIHDDLICLRDEDNGKCLINFDHHASNDSFGTHNLVDTGASSTSEIVYRFFELHGIPVDRDMATCLLTGLITDTGNFTNGATTKESLRIAAQLMRSGAKIETITRHVIQNKNVDALQIWGNVLSRLEIHRDLGIATTVILKTDFEGRDVSEDAVDGITNFLNNLSSVRAIMVLREQEGGIIKGSLRTTRDDVDVNELARHFGGGGHKKAAGFKVKGTLKEVAGKWYIE